MAMALTAEMEGNLGIESGFKSLNVNPHQSIMKEPSEESTDKKEEDESVVRHCAFCLKSVPLKDVIKCVRCQKRAYCSKECKLKDWTLNYGGQGHQNWCDFECGEEDIDWEVVPVPGKGLGLIAKRLLPARYRIMVDAPRQMNPPKIMELMPVNGTLEEKLHLNSMRCGNGASVLCLRISRANHDCDPNAAHNYDVT